MKILYSLLLVIFFSSNAYSLGFVGSSRHKSRGSGGSEDSDSSYKHFVLKDSLEKAQEIKDDAVVDGWYVLEMNSNWYSYETMSYLEMHGYKLKPYEYFKLQLYISPEIMAQKQKKDKDLHTMLIFGCFYFVFICFFQLSLKQIS